MQFVNEKFDFAYNLFNLDLCTTCMAGNPGIMLWAKATMCEEYMSPPLRTLKELGSWGVVFYS